MGSLRELDMDLARGVIAAAAEAIVVIDENGTVVFATPQAETLWGYTADELAGTPFRGLRERDQTARTKHAHAEFVGVRRDGTEFDADVRLSPVPTPHATFVAVVVRATSTASASPAANVPCTPAAQAAPGSSGGGASSAVARPRVLIVDDDPAVAKTLGRILADEHACTLALGGREAIARVEGGERYDVILCDLSMPDVGGEEVHRAIEAAAPDQAQRIVFVSGGAFTASSHSFLARVDNPRIDKPFEAQAIRTLVGDLVARGAPTSKS
jgi:PAS domain S-box-containing protein